MPNELFCIQKWGRTLKYSPIPPNFMAFMPLKWGSRLVKEGKTVHLAQSVQLGNVLVPEALQLIPTLSMGTSRNCAAPTGLKQSVYPITHRLRSGLRLLHPYGVFSKSLCIPTPLALKYTTNG